MLKMLKKKSHNQALLAQPSHIHITAMQNLNRFLGKFILLLEEFGQHHLHGKPLKLMTP